MLARAGCDISVVAAGTPARAKAALIALASFGFALALAFAVGFAPGIALAESGDSGTDSLAAPTQSQTNTTTAQSHHQNADPATSSTGSYVSKSVVSTPSSVNSSSSGSKSSAYSARASQNASAAPQVRADSATSGVSTTSEAARYYGNGGAATLRADECTRISARAKMKLSTATRAYQLSRSTSLPSSVGAGSTLNSASTSSSSVQPIGLDESSSALVPEHTSIDVADLSAEGITTFTTLDDVASDANFTHAAPLSLGLADVANSDPTKVPGSAFNPAKGLTTAARKEDALLTCDSALVGNEARGLSGSSEGLLNGAVVAEAGIDTVFLTAAAEEANSPVQKMPVQNAAITVESENVENYFAAGTPLKASQAASIDPLLVDPIIEPEYLSLTSSSALEDSAAAPLQTLQIDSLVIGSLPQPIFMSLNALESEEDTDGNFIESGDFESRDTDDVIDADVTNEVTDEGSNPDGPEGSETKPGSEGEGSENDPSDPSEDTNDLEEPAASSKVEIKYDNTEGGFVSPGFETIDAAGAVSPDGIEPHLKGTTATPRVGYHFTGWTVTDATDDSPKVVCDSNQLDADTVKSYALNKLNNCYKPVKFTSCFEANTYRLNLHANGGTATTDASVAPTTLTTFGNDDQFVSAQSLNNGTLKFAGWNTAPDGSGVPINEGDKLTSSKLRAMVLQSNIPDADGADITLYAQWRDPTPAIVNEGDEPASIQPVVTSGSNMPGRMTHDELLAYIAGLTKTPTTVAAQVRTVAAPVIAFASRLAAAPPVEDVEEEAPSPLDGLVEVAATLSDADNALALPPALEVLPAAAEQFTTMSTEALTGLSDASDGTSMSSADATRTAATVAGSVGAVVAAAGIAGAVASATARRRVAKLHGPQGFDR